MRQLVSYKIDPYTSFNSTSVGFTLFISHSYLFGLIKFNSSDRFEVPHICIMDYTKRWDALIESKVKLN